MRINLLPQKYTPDGEISIELMMCGDDEARKLIDQQKDNELGMNIGTCNLKKTLELFTKK